MNRRSKFLSLLLILVLLVTGCGGKEEVKEDKDQVEVADSAEDLEETDEEVIINLSGGDWGYPSPYQHYSRGPGSFKMKMVFDSLLERGEEGLIPWVAESWEISEDGKEYIFKIREGLKWHDGEDLTPEDIKFSIEYFREHPPVSDSLGLADNNYIDDILIEGQELKVIVNEANATILDSLGSSRIIPKHIWEDIEDPEAFLDEKSAIGSGPYMLEDYNKEQGAYKFKAFPEYWAKVKAEEVNFIPVSDELLSFENGEVDLIGVTPDILDKYESDDEYKLLENPAFWGYKLVFNMKDRPEFLEKELRQAIAHGIDREEMIEKVGRGAGKLASAGYLPEEHVDYNKDVKSYDFDLEKSKELLGGKEYDFTLLTGDSKSEVRIAELMKISLAEVGINLEVKSIDGKSRDAAIKNGEYDMALTGHGGWGNDPDILSQQYADLGKKPGIAGYSNDRINELSLAQFKEIDPDKRRDIIFELQEVIAEELPQIPLYNTVGYTVYRPAKYDGWKHIFNHHEVTHNKISYVETE